MNTKKDIAKHRDRAIQEFLNTYAQIDRKKVVEPFNPDTLSSEDKMKSLVAITFINEKRCGKLKGRTCADGRKQGQYLSKETFTSSTV